MQDAIDIKVLQTLGIARDRPSPYGEGETASTPVARGPVPRDLATETKTASTPVARGPVPRDLSTSAENARRRETPDVCCSARCMARDRPSPYGIGDGMGDGVGDGMEDGMEDAFLCIFGIRIFP